MWRPTIHGVSSALEMTPRFCSRFFGSGALTGPIARGDEATVARQRAAVAERTPELLALFDALAAATRDLAAVPA